MKEQRIDDFSEDDEDIYDDDEDIWSALEEACKELGYSNKLSDFITLLEDPKFRKFYYMDNNC